MAKLETIEGIGPIYAEKLRAAGVHSVDALLRAGTTPEKRKALQERTGIGHEYILDWVNRADLMRVKGIGEEYSDLLEKAGVDTVVELARRNPDNLHAKMLKANVGKRLVRRAPSLGSITDWVEQAKALPRVISY
jgi:predicted flap endonuclease-1-like 5' DNA nuclease